MLEQEQAKAGEALTKPPIQVGSGDVEVAKLQLAARWAEFASGSDDIDGWLKAFNKAYKSIDETLRA